AFCIGPLGRGTQGGKNQGIGRPFGRSKESSPHQSATAKVSPAVREDDGDSHRQMRTPAMGA
ncbi:hypothetical protein, partial [Bradyrhizobium pachyrhizi]|uniref:hypothetical protein n=1 Tax=Bradyrhizobium pachyrhizi TaxID=280333 RepID=UPI001FCDE705